jgi:hypothetical protein
MIQRKSIIDGQEYDDPEGIYVLAEDVRDVVLDYYKVAPKAAAPLLRKMGLGS